MNVFMEDKDKIDNNYKKFWELITNAMSFVGNEPIILAQLEQYFSPKPANLTDYTDAKTLQSRIDNLIVKMGGPPYLINSNEDKKTYDTHPAAIMDEVIYSFNRARKIICRAHMTMMGYELHKKHPDFPTGLLQDGEIREQFLKFIEDSFWEHCEQGYICLCSLWDRIGQVLDFVYFNIRQFERDGFPAVFDRIIFNIIPVDDNLIKLTNINKIREYHSSEKSSGLKWLLSRRNVLIHSLHLRKIQIGADVDLYDSAFNHFEDKYRKKLAPASPEEEVKILHCQLKTFTELFPIVLDVIEYGIDKKK